MKQLFAVFQDATGNLNLAEINAALMAFTAICMTVYDVCWRGQHFDIQAFGIGAGALVAAIGGAQRLRGDPQIEARYGNSRKDGDRA